MAKGEFSVKSCQEISISSRPEIQLAGNPSYFAVFSVIRLLIFEKWAKQHFRPLPVHSPSAQRTDNTNLNTTVDSIQVSKVWFFSKLCFFLNLRPVITVIIIEDNCGFFRNSNCNLNRFKKIKIMTFLCDNLYKNFENYTNLVTVYNRLTISVKKLITGYV